MAANRIEKNLYLSITREKIDLNNMYNFLENNSHGAISVFIGRIRDLNFGKKVIKVSYDVFKPLAIQNFHDICEMVQSKYKDDELKFYIEHFKGNLEVGEISVVIGVSATHRAEAIEGCSFIIEEVKHNSPIWKQEHYENETSEWIKGHSLCKGRKPEKNYLGNYVLQCEKKL